MHGGFLGLRVKARLRIRQVFTGKNHLLFDNDRLAIALQKALGAKRHRAGAAFGSARLPTFVDHADFQRGGAAQNVFGFGRVLHARQLHHDAVQPLLLNDRLGHTELVDAVVQRGDILLERLVLHGTGSGGID